MAGTVNNSKRIRAKFRRSAFLWAALLGVLAGIVTALLARGLFFGRVLVRAVLLITIAAFALSLIFCLLIARSRASRILKQVTDRASFDSDRLSEAGHSQYLFYGRDWFVWNKGNQFIILPRTEIVGAEMYPGQREGNDLGLLVLEKKNGETLHLAYDIVEGEDPAAQISDWCAEGEDLTSGQIEL